MKRIHVILDSVLLEAVDERVRKRKINRSALVREALRAHLETLSLAAREHRDRDGYVRYPDSRGQSDLWEKVALWPED